MRWFAFVLCVILPSWGWADNYLCIADETTGFAKRDGRYQQTNFTLNKYVVNSEKKTVNIFGVEGVFTGCVTDHKRVYCANSNIDFLMHRKKLKFMVYHKSFSYVWDDIEDSPHIAIGTCSKF